VSPRVAYAAIAVGAALAGIALQACFATCGDCNCPLGPSGDLTVTAATDPELVGAVLRFDGDDLQIRYTRDGHDWTASYAFTGFQQVDTAAFETR
jgi:hypothetical protein